MEESCNARGLSEFGWAAIVAGAAFLSALPFIDADAPGRTVELALSFGFAVAASLVGVAGARRAGLAGLGQRSAWSAAWPFLIVVAPLLAAIWYAVVGRPLAEVAPILGPRQLGDALALLLRRAVFDEVLRFGLLVLLAAILERRWLANLVQAVFLTVLGLLSLVSAGLEPSWGALAASSLAMTFLAELFAGALAARFGLGVAVAFSAIASLRFVAGALLR